MAGLTVSACGAYLWRSGSSYAVYNDEEWFQILADNQAIVGRSDDQVR